MGGIDIRPRTDTEQAFRWLAMNRQPGALETLLGLGARLPPAISDARMMQAQRHALGRLLGGGVMPGSAQEFGQIAAGKAALERPDLLRELERSKQEFNEKIRQAQLENALLIESLRQKGAQERVAAQEAGKTERRRLEPPRQQKKSLVEQMAEFNQGSVPAGYKKQRNKRTGEIRIVPE